MEIARERRSDDSRPELDRCLRSLRRCKIDPVTHTHPMLRTVLKSQYHASLAMLREAIERCPPEEWLSTKHKNAFWQVSYHALFFAHLYLQRDEAAFRLWEQHRGEGDGIAERRF